MTKPNSWTAPAHAYAAGRMLIPMTIEEAAERAGLEPEALQLFEAGEGELSARERQALGETLYDAGVLFKEATPLAGIGVRLRFGLDVPAAEACGFRGRNHRAARRRRR